MFDKTEELLVGLESTHVLVTRHVPAVCVEMLQLLTQGSQSGTCIWRIWHFMSVLLIGKPKNRGRTGRSDLRFGRG